MPFVFFWKRRYHLPQYLFFQVCVLQNENILDYVVNKYHIIALIFETGNFIKRTTQNQTNCSTCQRMNTNDLCMYFCATLGMVCRPYKICLYKNKTRRYARYTFVCVTEQHYVSIFCTCVWYALQIYLCFSGT